MPVWIWILIALSVGAVVGLMVGGGMGMAKRSDLEDENWQLRRDLIRWQGERLEL